MTKFLVNPQYRQQFEVQGSWNGALVFQTKTGVQIKPVCRMGIRRLNSLKGKIKFKEFAKLRTGGRDSFSRMFEEELKALLPQSTYVLAKEAAKENQWDQKSLLACLRWIARGLKPQLAVRKINVDLEIQENARKGKHKNYSLEDI